MKKIDNYVLYGETTQEIIPEFIHCESIEARSRNHDWVIKPHLHNRLYQFVIIEEGNFEFICGPTKQYITEPCLIAMPANTLHGYLFTPDIKGMVLTLSEEFIDVILNPQPQILLEIEKPRVIYSSWNNERFGLMSRLFKRVNNELLVEYDGKPLAIKSYVSILFVEFYRMILENKHSTFQVVKTNIKLFRAFVTQIKSFYSNRLFKGENADKKLTVASLANTLGISSVHLNRVCQDVASKSPIQVIHEYIISEAVRYLEQTDYTIAEISYKLKFEDPAYFSRFFKKFTGKSPTEYRQL
ncbi:AraC family transcriptional regulator [Nitritalea halalkaliphila LW7]|uniref:AraC family transcriptional regulator n=1 Tax=Nitritalea halalkaliphila LW7 TaxID=1189621 RepID=I5C0N7_9BACT|nr:helix-turn-helix domain-containing protein [Nitritalea halalkaliphila]EIM75389.1 AraC family transcriptional regulator [Nitritalea halalkaliphila LW7]